jgi:hypothetical protein
MSLPAGTPSGSRIIRAGPRVFPARRSVPLLTPPRRPCYKIGDLINAYLGWVAAHPLSSAAVQFGILGTLGEILSLRVRRRPLSSLGAWWRIVLKVAAWGLLGVVIKYGFTGMKGFVDALIAKGLLPRTAHGSAAWAFMVSVATNLFFGPQMMFFHRLEDSLIAWKWDLAGLKKAWLTLLWFWIPAHTVTFSLPADYQIGLAAVWSVALGLILGLTAAGAARGVDRATA